MDRAKCWYTNNANCVCEKGAERCSFNVGDQVYMDGDYNVFTVKSVYPTHIQIERITNSNQIYAHNCLASELKHKHKDAYPDVPSNNIIVPTSNVITDFKTTFHVGQTVYTKNDPNPWKITQIRLTNMLTVLQLYYEIERVGQDVHVVKTYSNEFGLSLAPFGDRVVSKE